MLSLISWKRCLCGHRPEVLPLRPQDADHCLEGSTIQRGPEVGESGEQSLHAPGRPPL